jgi:uncharacterized BrkB/YihY/UPF0761 family membrane protein
MHRSHFDIRITITILFTFILYSLLSNLAYGQQQQQQKQFAFANQTTAIIKNQINNNKQNKPASFSVHTGRVESLLVTLLGATAAALN